MNLEVLKKEAGRKAAENVKDGMTIGLGTGSTAYYTIERVAERIKEEKLNLHAVSTSFQTTFLCHKWGIPLLDISSVSFLDLAIDGADEIDPRKNLIKGKGAAHTLEKIVAAMARTFYVVADESKTVPILGTSMPVPVEILPHAYESTYHRIQDLGAERCVLRMAQQGKQGPIVSDHGNFIIDAYFKDIDQPKALEQELNLIPGVIDNGLFGGYANKVYLATEKGLEEF